MSDVLHIDAEPSEGRFARFQLIAWWDQVRLGNAKVLVIGAGALGNEIVKNLALLGVGNVLIADLDVIENSNLSRSVLFRAEDCGLSKAAVAARCASRIYPEIRVQPFQGNIVYDLGLGAFGWADVIVAGLDNREARVAINQAAARMGKIWIDGAIERLDGVARVFDPATGPCYECTMGQADWQMLEARQSCALLKREEMELGKVPTTPTTASVIAGIQCQEAIKLLHGLEVLSGQGFVFDGMRHQSYVVSYSRKDDCPAHETFEPIERLPLQTAATSAGQFLDRVRSDLGPRGIVEFSQDLLSSLNCPKCDRSEPRFASLGKVTEREARCPSCQTPRIPRTYHTLEGGETFLERSLADLGVPAWDVVGGRSGSEQRFYEFAGDCALVLGPLQA